MTSLHHFWRSLGIKEATSPINFRRGLPILGVIWLVGAVSDRIWFALDHSVPSWDQADYLTGSLNYWRALQSPEWFSGEWWQHFWLLSSKIPPLFYIATAIVQNAVGTGPDQAALVQLLFSAILLGSVYVLGIQLFNVRIGLWAALLCQLLPGLYRYRLEFLLDYPLTAIVTFTFCCLTVWWNQGLKVKRLEGLNQPTNLQSDNLQPENLQLTKPLKEWLWAAAFGLSLGIALMVKQTSLFFLVVPILWVGVSTIQRRYWGRVAQLMGSLFLSVLVFGPWYRTNWLLMLMAGKRATIDSAIAEGDPPLNTLDAWLYYWKILPYLVSWPLLLVPIVGLIIYWGRSVLINYQNKQKTEIAEPEIRGKSQKTKSKFKKFSSFQWLAIFGISGYLLCSLNVNKDARYILPLLPVVSLVLAYGLTQWKGLWVNNVRWGTISLAILLMLLNLFPIGGHALTQLLSPRVQNYAYLGATWPHRQVIDEIIKTSPYLRTTLGVLPSTPEINQHNLNYYGALENFQVYGRQVGTRKKYVEQDARSLSWFLTKTGEQGSVPDAQTAIVQFVEKGQDFQLCKTWNLPDGSTLNLYQKRQPFVQVQPLPQEIVSNQLSTFSPINSITLPVNNTETKVQLEQIQVPETIPPGVPVPVTYNWIGSWEHLQSGIVLLTWKSTEGTVQSRWLHDHGIGMGELKFPKELKVGRLEDWNVENVNLQPTTSSNFRVIEQIAMLPPADIPAGTYTLEATYLNRKTGQTYPISVPSVTLKIDPSALAIPAPELDLVTQLRAAAAGLPKGREGLEPVFEQTGRINQYDPIQDYLVQAQLALSYRLEVEPNNRDWAYALALSEVLQRDVEGAIASLERVTQLDSQNPYAYAYLAFVHLYNWHPKDAENALKPALALNPNLPDIKALSGVAALLRGNV
ncbi:MAG TPA: phospholipid carrier-dependent glycosyltransferase, partial [Coleofasciculaceae cyanobacterium]